MKTVVVTSTSPYRKEMFELTYLNMLEYCNWHGYDSHVIALQDGDWAYKKHETVKKLFKQGYELIWYRDDDGLITNMKIKIEDFIDDYYSFYLTADAGGFNGGSIIIKNTNVGVAFNEMVLDSRGLYPNEQDFYNGMPMLTFGIELMKPLKHPSINSYKYELYKEFPERIGREDLGDWQPNHLFLHLPALTIEKRIEVIKSTPITR